MLSGRAFKAFSKLLSNCLIFPLPTTPPPPKNGERVLEDQKEKVALEKMK